VISEGITLRQFATTVVAAAVITVAGWAAGSPLAKAGNDQEFLNAAAAE
jgi:hypothetical protein